MEMFTKVLIFDDDIVSALEMRDVLETSEFEVVGIADSCASAMDLFREHSPDLLLCCIYLNSGEVAINFVELSREIKKVPVIYVSSHDDEETLNRVLDSSPESYITRPFTAKQLLVTAKCAAYKCKCRSELRRMPPPTRRELEIIQYLAKGKSTMEIADDLCISYETVKSHRKNIYKKFCVSTGSETVALAYKYQWLS